MAARLNIFSILPDDPSSDEEVTQNHKTSHTAQKQQESRDQAEKKPRNRKGIILNSK